MNRSTFAFESAVIISVRFKVSTNPMRDPGQMLKCHSWYVPQQEQVLPGPAGKWSLHAGRRRGGCSSPCPSASSFWTGSKSSGPARPTGSCKFDYTLSVPSANGETKLPYASVTNENATIRWNVKQQCHCEMNLCSARDYELRKWTICLSEAKTDGTLTISVELIKVSLKWLQH